MGKDRQEAQKAPDPVERTFPISTAQFSVLQRFQAQIASIEAQATAAAEAILAGHGVTQAAVVGWKGGEKPSITVLVPPDAPAD